ncbi:hypothetical protein DCCM_0629 [Desulfocucumis palustris]|uniref:Uncharacterized protein n=1 Tax=Desulfocucumis palustris TaxID=1898651 RepID=A0A2L2X9Y9_9FIRM|nr:hypothetical protein DCCM_0629 [Desulfocucumis palustris]
MLFKEIMLLVNPRITLQSRPKGDFVFLKRYVPGDIDLNNDKHREGKEE